MPELLTKLADRATKLLRERGQSVGMPLRVGLAQQQAADSRGVFVVLSKIKADVP